jgi:hypothetical protein
VLVADYFEIDFIDVESPKSGDAIALRYEQAGRTSIHVVDAGYQDTGAAVVEFIKAYYDNATYINHVVATHSDGDHSGGLRTVLGSFSVGVLWIHRPWIYAEHLLPWFPTYTSVERLAARLRDVYSNLAALEEIALRKGVVIQAPFQGADIGAFTVMAPNVNRFAQLILDSDRTPESYLSVAQDTLGEFVTGLLAKATKFVKGVWGHEVFSVNETSAENEMSVIQYAKLCDQRIVLTGDAGRGALADAIQFAPQVGVPFPGVDYFQVPHHGFRRNVSTETLDALLGPRVPDGAMKKFTGVCSAAAKDDDHPRKSVKRAIIHRGGHFYSTKGRGLRAYGGVAPTRQNWIAVTPEDYPQDQEED